MTLKQSIGLAIVLFWCGMNFLLVKRQLWQPTAPLFLRSGEAVSGSVKESWGVYYRGEKIGDAHQTITPNADGYQLIDDSRLRLNLLGTTQMAWTRLSMEADKEWVLKDFAFTLQTNEILFKARGRVIPGKLQLEIESAGEKSKREITLTQPPYLMPALKPLVATQQLEPHKEHFFTTFDPATLSQQITSLTIEDREHILINGNSEAAIRFRQKFKGLSVTSWIDGQGRTLKEESPGGFSLIRESRHEATGHDSSRALSLDMIAQSAIPVSSTISELENKNLLRLKLTGVDLANFALDGGRQKSTSNELQIEREKVTGLDTYRIPLQDRRLNSFLQPTAFMQSDHPKISHLARQIIGDQSDAGKAVVHIKDWVYRNIKKEPTVSIPSALEVLQIGRGDCNEHTVLFNALARAVGIPARTVVGLVHLREAFHYHAWSEVWLGRWLSLDSTLDQFPADVTHIKFVEGEIDRQVDILQLIGRLKIEVLQAK